MDTLSENSEHRSRITRQELGIQTISGCGDRTEMESNRMSLYEQLTVSAHRFAKLSESCRPSSAAFSCREHSIIKESQQSSSSPPSPFLPPLDKSRTLTCPIFGTSEGTTVCESRSNDTARRQPAMSSDLLLKTVAISTVGENLDYRSKERVARSEEHLALLLLPSHSNENKGSNECLALLPLDHSNRNKEVLISLVSGQDTPVSDVMMLVKGAESLSIGDGLCGASTCNEEIFSAQSEDCTHVGMGSKKMVSTVDVPPKALTQDHTASEGQQDAKQEVSSEHCLHQVETLELGHTPQSQEEGMTFEADMDVQDQGECCSERCMVINEGDHDAASRGATAHASPEERDSDLELAPLDQDAKFSKRSQESLLPILDVMAGGSTDNAEAPNDIQAENGLNDIEVGGAPPISPKSVIQTVGQLRFWKARLALIRQQRVFSDQVFELHKLIEVQRLIAGTPNVPINEMYFGVGNMITGPTHNTAPCGSLDEDNAESSQKQVSVLRKVGKAPAIVREANSTLCNGQANLPANTAIAKNEVNAWRYSGSGVSPASTKNGASPYSPFALINRVESFSQEARGGKRQKGRKQPQQSRELSQGQAVVEGFASVNPSMSALNLFPLAPALTSDCETRWPSKGGKGLQGHVTSSS